MPKKFNIKTRVTSVLRKLSMQWPAIGECRRNARVAPGEYQCKRCGFIDSKIDVNHKEPVIDPEDGFVSFDVYIARLFVPVEGLEAICKECHKEITNKQRSRR